MRCPVWMRIVARKPFELICHYPAADFSGDRDHTIIQAVGKQPWETGCGLWENATRDLCFGFCSFNDTVAARRRVVEGCVNVTAFVRER